MFEYKEGYLEKVVAKTPLSEDLVTLRMDSIRHLVQLDVPTTSQEEAKDPADFQEENDEQGWYLPIYELCYFHTLFDETKIRLT